jgi:integrase
VSERLVDLAVLAPPPGHASLFEPRVDLARSKAKTTAEFDPLLFPAPRGGYISLERFRSRERHPPLSAAGLPAHRIYDMRHTYAAWSLAAGISLFALSRRMGTSVAMIDATYGHLAPDAEEQEAALLDAFDASEAAKLRLSDGFADE